MYKKHIVAHNTYGKILLKGGIDMTLLRWIGAIVVLFWILGFLFRVGGAMIHWLLILAVIVFIVDVFTGRRNRSS